MISSFAGHGSRTESYLFVSSLNRLCFQKIFFTTNLYGIGSTATGVDADRQDTSLRVYVPGVHVLAMASDNLLHGDRYRMLSFGSQVCCLPA